MPPPKASLHERVRPLGWLRRCLRRAFFFWLRRVAQTDDAREMIAAALRGLTQPAGCLPNLERELCRAPYPELGQATAEGMRSDAVFITSRFRSGSTLLWNLFRHVDGITAYYEPLNERRFFDPATRGTWVDPTHRHVADYWSEYDGLEVLAQCYHESWVNRNLCMGPEFWDADLRRYIDILIAKAPGRPVLQFNRVDFRLPWLRRHYPAARIVHLYRHPRDQWLSSLPGAKDFPTAGQLCDFAAHDHYYLLSWGRDLKHSFPFLDEQRIEHPYQLFYYIWKLSFVFGCHYADYSLAYEDLLRDPRQELERLFAFLEIRTCDLAMLASLIERPTSGRWACYAGDEWFKRHEAHCERVLGDFFGVERPLPKFKRAPARSNELETAVQS